MFAVQGVILDPDGSPAGPGIPVNLAFREAASGPIQSTESLADGRFRIQFEFPRSWTSAWPASLRADDGGLSPERHPHAPFALSARRPDGSAASRTHLARLDEAGPDLWIVLQLVKPTRITATAVDAQGHVVPRARVRFLVSHREEPQPWDHRAFQSSWHEVEADSEGRAILDSPADSAFAWARAPGGLYGRRLRGTVEERILDFGNVEVGGATTEVELRIRDGVGEPVSGGRIRLESAHAVQRWLRHDPGNSRSFAASDSEGRIVIRTSTGPQPLLAGVAAPGFSPMNLAIDVSRSGKRSHEVVLRSAPRLRLRVRTQSGASLPASIKPVVQVTYQRPDGSFGVPTSRVDFGVLGGVDEASARARLDQMDPTPAQYLDSFVRSVNPSPGSLANGIVRDLAGPGRYLVRVHVAPGIRAETFCDVSAESTVNAEVAIPDGRRVSVDFARPTSGDWTKDRLWVWPASGMLPADDWPANRREVRDAVTSGAVVQWDHSRPLELWIPTRCTHLFCKWLPFGERGGRLDTRYRTEYVIPGTRRWPGVEDGLANRLTARIAVPEQTDADIRAAPPDPIPQLALTRVAVSIEFAGSPLRQPGIDVQARRTRALPGLEIPKRFPRIQVSPTVSNGVATLHLLPAHYEVSVRGRDGPSRPVALEVLPGSGPLSVVVRYAEP